jgi:Fe-Mn family superoxide dismutase
MEKTNFYVLPKLPFDYADLEPFMSKEQLTIHHDKHHQAYVTGANNILQKLDKARKEGTDLDVKSTLKELSFNIGGHVLHSAYWNNLAPPKKGGGGKPSGTLAKEIDKEFGSFDRFKKEFTQAATSVEGSGWAALTFDRKTKRPIIMQVEKHNTNVYPGFRILMVLDVFEHAYYIDWNIVNWDKVNERLEEFLRQI